MAFAWSWLLFRWGAASLTQQMSKRAFQICVQKAIAGIDQLCGITRVLASSSSLAISPKASRAMKPGIGKRVGRQRTCPASS